MNAFIEQNREIVQHGLDMKASARAAAVADARMDAEEQDVFSIINQESAAANAKRERTEQERLAFREASKATAYKHKRKIWAREFIHNIVHHVGLAAIVYVGFLYGLPIWTSVLLGLMVIISARDRFMESIRAFPKK